MATPALPQPSWRKTPLQPIDLWQHLRDNAHQLGQSHNGSSQAVRVLRAARDAYVDAQQKRKHTLALDLLEQALRIKRGFLGADNYFVRKAERELTRCCNTIALCELKAGRISSAEHLLLQGLNRNPSPSAKEALLTNLGLCKYHGGDYSGARRLWGSMKKPCPYLLLALSATYFQENDTTFALLYATKAVEECNRRERYVCCSNTLLLRSIHAKKVLSTAEPFNSPDHLAPKATYRSEIATINPEQKSRY